MRRIFFASRFINTDEYDIDSRICLEYYMINHRIMSFGAYVDCYGTEVVKKYVDSYGNEVSQKNSVKNITYNKKEIYNLLRMLYSCSITPMNLEETIDEYFSLTEHIDEKQA